MNDKGIIFDVNGDSLLIENTFLFIGELKDRLLIKSYRATVYKDEVNKAYEELLDKGYIRQDDEYIKLDQHLIDNAVNTMKDEIISRFGEAYLLEVYNTIDLSFKDKKPKI